MHFTHALKKQLRRACMILTTISLSFGGSLPHLVRANEPEAPISMITVIIEEIAWAGSSLSSADEWIELANMGHATATLAGWSVNGIAPLPVFLPENAEIAPGGTYRIANYVETDEKSALSVVVQLATTTVALSNSALGVTLLDASGVVIDRAGNSGTPFAGTSSPRATMVRSATSSGDLADAWITATSSIGFKTTGIDFGAPGFCALCAPASQEETPLPTTDTDLTVTEAGDLLSPDEPDAAEEVVETVASSTKDVIANMETATSTTPSIPANVTSTEASVTTTTTTSETSSVTSSSATTSSNSSVVQRDEAEPRPYATPLPILVFRVNEVVSNPETGPEWIELRIDSAGATSTDRALEMWDASGRIANIPAHTPFTAPGYLVVTLASARLNNSGDDVFLRDTSGVVLNFIHVPALEDGVAWARNESGLWLETDILTPSGTNQFPAISSVSQSREVVRQNVVATSSSTASTTVRDVNAAQRDEAEPRPYTNVRLNEVVSNPDGGSEWVELFIADINATTTDRALELWDAAGRIATIPMHTPFTAPGYLTVTLTSARLNNGGDDLSLRNAGSDLVLDSVTIPSLARGIAWARDEAGAWTDTDSPTPGMLNIFSADDAEAASNTENQSTKTSSSKSTASTSLISYDNAMPKEPVSSARVRLVGTVGSVPRLLGATHAFILLGEDGRAAIAYLPKHLNTPQFGSTVRVMGTLTVTERQMELRMKTTDVWMTVSTSTPPHPRTIDFLAPGTDDAWGLVVATGTVTNVGTTRVLIDVDAVEVSVAIPTVSGYRAKRLTVGDTIRVTGLFDPRKEAPTIMIRVPEDIFLVSHAPASVTVPQATDKTSLPDWTPFGAAAGAVAMTGGVQRLRTYLKKRKLAAMAGVG